MSLWKKVFGHRTLPRLSERHLHKNFAECGIDPTPGKGGKLMDEFIPAWNAGEYDKAFALLKGAIAAGLEGPDESSAHSYLGQIHIKRGNLREAVDEFLECLRTPHRPSDITWESAMRLYYIYSEAGESLEAANLLSLAEEAHLRLRWPRKHLPTVETEIRALARQSFQG